ncbi:hypothetical protein [Aeromonas caviae]|uniref:hypothetical protein n=1 Tax=Aeromonas caviae TaxID=648 RepID=UPI0029D7CF41|nr:hypothetical protein [Aeromonas caviae]MDX7784793.1 hypothetical protein [Aeromonas caviae]
MQPMQCHRKGDENIDQRSTGTLVIPTKVVQLSLIRSAAIQPCNQATEAALYDPSVEELEQVIIKRAERLPAMLETPSDISFSHCQTVCRQDTHKIIKATDAKKPAFAGFHN